MQLGKDVSVDVKDGKLAVSVDLDAALLPALQALKAKIDSGAIDLVKGTDLDKMALDAGLDMLIKAISAAPAA